MKKFFWGSWRKWDFKAIQFGTGFLGGHESVANLKICKSVPKILNFAFCQCKLKQGVGNQLGSSHLWGKRGLHQQTSKKSPVRKKSCSFKKSFFFSSHGGFLKEKCFFLLMILPCQKFCQVTSLGVVPRSRKVLLQLCVGTSNGFSTNLHDWWCQQQWCQYQSAVVSFVCLAPFFDARHLWGWVPTFFFHTKENGSARALAAIIVEHPLHCSGRIPCQALLTPARVYWFPRVAPAWAICPFWNTCEQGNTQALPGFLSLPQLEVLPPPRNHTDSRYPSAPCKRSALALGAGDVCDCYLSDCPKVPDNKSSCQCLGVYCCVGLVVQGAFCHSVTVT